MRHAASGLVVLPLLALSPLAILAQGANPPTRTERAAPAVEPPLAQFIARNVSGERWPKANVSATRDGYVAVLAITPGENRFAVQVLSPSEPGDDGFIRPRHPETIRYFSPDALGHRVARGSSMAPPIVIAVASRVKPDLSSFARGSRWAEDLVINVPIDSTTDLVDVLAQVMFASDTVRYSVTRMDNLLDARVAGTLTPGGPTGMGSNGTGSGPTTSLARNQRAYDCASTIRVTTGPCSVMLNDSPGAYRWAPLPASKPRPTPAGGSGSTTPPPPAKQ